MNASVHKSGEMGLSKSVGELYDCGVTGQTGFAGRLCPQGLYHDTLQVHILCLTVKQGR